MRPSTPITNYTTVYILLKNNLFLSNGMLGDENEILLFQSYLNIQVSDRTCNFDTVHTTIVFSIL